MGDRGKISIGKYLLFTLPLTNVQNFGFSVLIKTKTFRDQSSL